jgi:DNA-binding NarL/FixJ family response regulator
MKSRIRVLCVDDHPLVREALVDKIRAQRDMTVVASAEDGLESLSLFKQHRPDVTLMDLQLPVMSGVEAIRAIRQEHLDARIIAYTIYQDDEDIFRAWEAGASPFVVKTTLSDGLIMAIRDIHAGAPAIPSSVVMPIGRRTIGDSLTDRELEVVNLIARGMRNKEVAAMLRISENTVEAHVRNIFGKLKVRDRTAAVTVALRRGMIHLSA